MKWVARWVQQKWQDELSYESSTQIRGLWVHSPCPVCHYIPIIDIHSPLNIVSSRSFHVALDSKETLLVELFVHQPLFFVQ